MLMLAGAGTGKTAALTARLAHLIATRKAWPSQILAVTFTNKAAREMKERIAAISGGAIEGMPWLGTFHSVAARMLRSHAELVGLQSQLHHPRHRRPAAPAQAADPRRQPRREALARAPARRADRPLEEPRPHPGACSTPPKAKPSPPAAAQEFYAAYQARLATLNACDFGDLLLHMLTIFKAHPDVLDAYRDRFHYILVDEYQDTNASQYDWLRLLAEPRRNICCVGDDDQSIYSWRGAEVANILRFEKDFPGAAIIRLEQNYRSTPHILGAAAGLIAHNSGRLGKTLWTDAQRRRPRQGDRRVGRPRGSAPRRRGDRGPRSAAAARLDDCAILVRAQFQTREFEERFIAIGLAYQIVGGFRFYERAEIRDALAYLRLIAQPADDLAFERIVNTPKRGLGDKAVAAHPRLRPRHRPAAAPRRRADARQRRNDPAGAQVARPLRRRHRPLADAWPASSPTPSSRG